MMDKYLNDDNLFILSEMKNVLLVILTIIDLIFIFLSVIYSFDMEIDILFADYDFLVCLLLFVDLSYEFYTTDRSIKEFFIDDKNLLSLISLLPFDLLFRYFAVFRLFRFLRIFKVVRVWHVFKDIDSLNYFIQNHLFKSLFIILGIYIGLASVLLIIFDDGFSTIGDAFWFIMITTSTVGYGDMVPVSAIGKALTILTIIMGIIFVAILTAYLSAVYNEKTEKETRDKVLEWVETAEQDYKILNKELEEVNGRLENIEKENRELKKLILELKEK